MICVSLIVGAMAINAAGEVQPTATIYGRILDPFGSPINKARVEVSSEDPALRFSAFTHEEGSYKVINVPAGQYVIVVSSPGFITERMTVRVKKSVDVLLDFGLVAGYTHDSIPLELSGKVQQSDNAPLRDATVTVKNAFNQRLTYNVSTDEAGQYKIHIDYPGQYIVYASKPGFRVSATSIVLPAKLPRETRKADFVLSQLQVP
jgi:hypothetical protein